MQHLTHEQGTSYLVFLALSLETDVILELTLTCTTVECMMATKRANQSGVWEHMDKMANGKVQCRLCNKQLAYCKGGSTTSLMHHLKTMHPTECDAKTSAASKTQCSLPSFGVGPQRPCSESMTLSSVDLCRM